VIYTALDEPDAAELAELYLLLKRIRDKVYGVKKAKDQD